MLVKSPFESLDSTGVKKDSARQEGQVAAGRWQEALTPLIVLLAANCSLPAPKAKRQDRPPAVCDLRNCGALFPFIDCFLEFVSRCEFCDTASGDLDGRSCLRVPAIASLALGDGECSESDQGYPVPFFEGSSYAVHGGIDRGRRLRLRNTAGSGDPINEICFVHALS